MLENSLLEGHQSAESRAGLGTQACECPRRREEPFVGMRGGLKRNGRGILKVCCARVLKPAAREHSVIGNFGKLMAFYNIPARQGNLFINS